MQGVMIELAEMLGFNFIATTFPELFLNMFLAICGTCILASIIKVCIWIPFNSKKLL